MISRSGVSAEQRIAERRRKAKEDARRAREEQRRAALAHELEAERARLAAEADAKAGFRNHAPLRSTSVCGAGAHLTPYDDFVIQAAADRADAEARAAEQARVRAALLAERKRRDDEDTRARLEALRARREQAAREKARHPHKKRGRTFHPPSK